MSKSPLINRLKYKLKAFGVEPSVITSIILTFLFTVVAAIITSWLFSKEPHLTKRVSDLLAFQGEKGEVGILNINLSSDGSKEAEEVVGRIEINGSTIEDVKIEPKIIDTEKSIIGDVLVIKCKSLIPGDTLQVAVLAKKPVGLPLKPKVEFRAKGIMAEEREYQQSKPTFTQQLLSSGLIGAVAGSAFSAVLWLFTVWFVNKMKMDLEKMRLKAIEVSESIEGNI